MQNIGSKTVFAQSNLASSISTVLQDTEIIFPIAPGQFIIGDYFLPYYISGAGNIQLVITFDNAPTQYIASNSGVQNWTNTIGMPLNQISPSVLQLIRGSFSCVGHATLPTIAKLQFAEQSADPAPTYLFHGAYFEITYF
jgi:hypothetical protein